MNTFEAETGIKKVYFSLDITETKLDRVFPKTPFVPTDKKTLDGRCSDIFTMQAVDLMTRLRHTGSKNPGTLAGQLRG